MTRQNQVLPAFAVATCGALWGIYWLPLRWFETQGIGGGWVSVVFSVTCLLCTLPWLCTARAWNGARRELVTGLIIGTGFSLYTVSLVLTDVIHGILLFYLTPVWSTLAGWLLGRWPLTAHRVLAIILGFVGMGLILGVMDGLPIPRNPGDWLALASGMLWSWGTMRSFEKPSPGIALPVFGFAAGGLASSVGLLLVAGVAALPLAQSAGLVANLPWIVLAALIIFVPPNFMVLWASQRIDPGRVGILLMTEVLVGALSAALYSGDSFTWADGLGTALIVASGLTEVLARR